MSNNVLILGCSGMLGGMCTQVLAKNPEIQLYGASRTYPHNDSLKEWYNFELKYDNLEEERLIEIIKNHKINSIINAIGTIKPHIDENKIKSRNDAILINSIFPSILANIAEEYNVQVIQITTDCVYSGKSTTTYNENSPHDATDIYGKTKSLGEIPHKNIIHLRCSIVGPEFHTKSSLLEWFLNQPQNATISGYTNHQWNGITTYHFAKICEGIITKFDLQMAGTQHIVPSDTVDKYTLVNYFAKYYNRQDIIIEPKEAEQIINRALTTKDTINNKLLWNSANYKIPPTIEQMIEELSKF